MGGRSCRSRSLGIAGSRRNAGVNGGSIRRINTVGGSVRVDGQVSHSVRHVRHVRQGVQVDLEVSVS